MITQIQGYKVLVEQDIVQLTKTVNKYISSGWRPQGGISTAVLPTNVHFFQAMIKSAVVQ